MSAFQENFANFSSPEAEEEVNSDSETSFPDLELWCYVDPQGNPQGPFPSAKMLRWHQFFHRNMRVWSYGSSKPITYEEFLRQHNVNPLWTYFDEENEPLIYTKKTTDASDDSDSDNDNIQRNYKSKELPAKDITKAAAVNNSQNIPEDTICESSEEENGVEPMSESSNETDEYSRKTDSEASEKYSGESDVTFQDNLYNQKSKKLPGHGIDVDVGVNDNVPDVYKQFAAVDKKTPVDPLAYTPYRNDKQPEKENVQPIEEIPNSNSVVVNRTYGDQMWNRGQIQMNIPQMVHRPYYMAIPPPLPAYLNNPPPMMWQMRAPAQQHNLPSSSYAPVNLPPSPYFAGQDHRVYSSYPSNRFPPPPNIYTTPQPGAVQQIQHQVYQQYSQNYNNDRRNYHIFESQFEKIMKEKYQQPNRENQKLKMSNEQLQVKKPQKALEYTGDISFAKMVSTKEDKGTNGAEKKKVEVKSFWATMPEPQPPKAPQKKVNKYPAGFVADGAKKKIEVHPNDGVAEFTDWCLNTLNYISENKLNVDGLRVVLNDMETIASVERYIKMWLDDFNPKMWQLFNDKLKKFRKEGNSDELSSPARANPYDVERQKQKEKMQKKAELFPQNKDINTMNISRHLTKKQQFGKK